MIVLSGAGIVLPDRILSPGTLVIDGERLAEVRAGEAHAAGPPGAVVTLGDHYIVPGFIDVHVHGIAGLDTLGSGDPVKAIAERLPRHGVTAFCPTSVACPPASLRSLLDQVARARAARSPGAARVLPAHLESNFISPEYAGAQPASCLRAPRAALEGWARGDAPRGAPAGGFDAADILREIARAASEVGIVTVAPELDGGLDLVAWLSSRGHRVSLGHSAATYEEAKAAIAAGARHATHLFNRMTGVTSRAPGLVGAVLQTDEVVAEIICDGVHVHPAVMRVAVAAKGPARVLAITDGTAASGLPIGGRAALGSQAITAGETVAVLADGTWAGSLATMDGAFRLLVERVGLTIADAAIMCSTAPARALGLSDLGVIAPGALADLAVLDRSLSVVQTYIGGRLAYARGATAAPSDSR